VRGGIWGGAVRGRVGDGAVRGRVGCGGVLGPTVDGGVLGRAGGGDVSSWAALRARRLAEPGAMAEYDAAELAFELGAALRGLREERGWSQSSLAEAARTTQPVVARLEAGGAVPTVAVLQRLARALEVRLDVIFRAAEQVGFPPTTTNERA
jgi:DNA-binding XRE family transcriptional regulator